MQSTPDTWLAPSVHFARGTYKIDQPARSCCQRPPALAATAYQTQKAVYISGETRPSLLLHINRLNGVILTRTTELLAYNGTG